jgi:hypothetical protein
MYRHVLKGWAMATPLSFGRLRAQLLDRCQCLPDTRRGRNTQYTVADAALAAFGCFFLQAPSFLAYQRQMERQQERNNARSLFGVERLPSDDQIRNLLDPVSPDWLGEPFWSIFADLSEGGYLDAYTISGTLLCTLDGTRYFSSLAVHCPNCSTTATDGQIRHYHAVLMPALVRPGKAEVVALEPEFIVPQDGHTKQDCEREAAKRWIARQTTHFAGHSVTILGDDLYCNQPLCQLLVDRHLHFILTCKPDSHPALYEDVAGLDRLGAVSQLDERVWTGRGHERRTYRWVVDVPLRAETPALLVNWCEVTVVDEVTGAVRYHNAFATDHALTEQTVRNIVLAGRCRWKIENEDINVLKNHGYHLEHNYGHGAQHLSTVLIVLTLLAFLWHTVLHLADASYAQLRTDLGARRTFFEHARTLTHYLFFASWENLLAFMLSDSPPPPD